MGRVLQTTRRPFFLRLYRDLPRTDTTGTARPGTAVATVASNPPQPRGSCAVPWDSGEPLRGSQTVHGWCHKGHDDLSLRAFAYAVAEDADKLLLVDGTSVRLFGTAAG